MVRALRQLRLVFRAGGHDADDQQAGGLFGRARRGRRGRDGDHESPRGNGPVGSDRRRIVADPLDLVAPQASVEPVQHAVAGRLGNDGPRACAGQSLAFGFNAVATEMPAPIGKEFGRIFDEQNLGVAMDDSLRAMCERVPNLDLRFFVTAVILQRQTGGDLSEILDKIGSLIRSRFKILAR